MRLTAFLILMSVGFALAGKTYSQTKMLSLKMESTSVKEVLAEIENQSEFYFMYSGKLIDVNREVSVDFENSKIDQVLHEVFDGTDVNYVVKDRFIVLTTDETSNDLLSDQEQRSVSGTVTDDSGLPLPGVTVLISGTTHGTVTNVDGKYTVTNIPDGASLVFSFVGMRTQEVAVGTQSSIDVSLVTDAIGLDEVVAIGYGTKKKINLTGAVAQVKMDEVLGDRPVTSVASALQGTIPGLQVTGGSSPGESKSLNIRGITSIASLGDSPTSSGEPLVLIDNVPGSIDLLNPEDIESISVLKDAASAAIYGARGAFGVVLITTKKAKKGETFTLNYGNNFAFQTAINRPQQASVIDYLETMKDFLNAPLLNNVNIDDYIGYVNEYNADPSGFAANHSGDYFEDGRFIPAGEDYYYYLTAGNPQEAILDDYGFQQTHNVSATGGTEKLSYRMAMGYTDQNGPLITNKDNFDRINLTSYISADVTDWLTQSIDVGYTKSNRSYVQDGEMWSVFKTSDPVVTPTGSMPASYDLEGTVYPVFTPANFLRYADPSKWVTENTRLFSRTAIHPFKGFEAILEYTYESNTRDYKRYTNATDMIKISNSVDNQSGDPRYYNTKTGIALNSVNAYASYTKELGDGHNFKAMAGYSQETRDYEALAVNANQMINPEKPSFTSATGIYYVSDRFVQYAIRSGFFRLNYDYKDRYLLEVNGRYDGSSKFPTDTRFGFFPSVSAGWRIDSESFMDDTNDWLDLAKLRVSYGELGNQAGVAEYGYMPTMSAGLASWLVNGQFPVTLNPPALVRTDYSWEVVQTLDFGFDIAMLNSRLSSTFDWYKRNTIGMLAPGVQLPAVVGASAPDQNAADLETKGWELSVQWKDRIGEWRYGVGFNLFDSKSVITKYDNEAGLFYDAATNSNYREGMELGEIWGYVTDGFYTADDFSDLSNFVLKEGVPSLNGYTAKPGDVKFVNLDGDEANIISTGENTVYAPGDRKIIGNSTPRYQYGINANAGWKAFDLSVLLQGTGKRDAWVRNDLMFGPTLHYVGVYEDNLDYWQPVDMENGDFTAANPDAYLPRIYSENENRSSNYRVQTKYLSDASYLRVKNVTLSYTFPKQTMSRIGLAAGKVFFSGENILTFSSLTKGVDPERLGWGYPFYATYSFGINLTL
ncbi:TonB-dependent receptor [Draconibacterium sp. IB214405]|uniref:TonB-dependent receptor n=1 Tax=Draconibacterium sp. IB214405 TaxID=3097352 RepID=UPI002A176A3E|nr:TonB-dependent receptor [Draconibacterium sp. IB214405]MDX8338683.1 TonB-dependent receptor [Draconibacterium sp. IB214405]